MFIASSIKFTSHAAVVVSQLNGQQHEATAKTRLTFQLRHCTSKAYLFWWPVYEHYHHRQDTAQRWGHLQQFLLASSSNDDCSPSNTFRNMSTLLGIEARASLAVTMNPVCGKGD